MLEVSKNSPHPLFLPLSLFLSLSLSSKKLPSPTRHLRSNFSLSPVCFRLLFFPARRSCQLNRFAGRAGQEGDDGDVSDSADAARKDAGWSVFEAVARAFLGETSPGLRRTAGDALSDLGDPRAVPFALAALGHDGGNASAQAGNGNAQAGNATSRYETSKLVRWRAARIIGEMGEHSAEVAAWLEAKAKDEPAYEVTRGGRL